MSREAHNSKQVTYCSPHNHF